MLEILEMYIQNDICNPSFESKIEAGYIFEGQRIENKIEAKLNGPKG